MNNFFCKNTILRSSVSKLKNINRQQCFSISNTKSSNIVDVSKRDLYKIGVIGVPFEAGQRRTGVSLGKF